MSASATTSAAGPAISEPRLWHSTTSPSSSPAVASNSPRAGAGVERAEAIRTAGQNAASSSAALAFSYPIGAARRPSGKLPAFPASVAPTAQAPATAVASANAPRRIDASTAVHGTAAKSAKTSR